MKKMVPENAATTFNIVVLASTKQHYFTGLALTEMRIEWLQFSATI
jgi:hypothetical protein